MKHSTVLLIILIILAFLWCITSCQKFSAIAVTYQRIIGKDKHEHNHAFFCDADSADYKGFDTLTVYYNNLPDTNRLHVPVVIYSDTGRTYYWYNGIISIK